MNKTEKKLKKNLKPETSKIWSKRKKNMLKIICTEYFLFSMLTLGENFKYSRLFVFKKSILAAESTFLYHVQYT